MVCRALYEIDLSNVEKRVLIAMDGSEHLVHAADELPGLNLEAFAGNRFRFVRRVAATALREPISLALIGHVNHAPLGLMLKRLRPGLRYGVMTHGVEVWSSLSRLKRRALRAADFVLSVSEFTKRQLVEKNGVDPERVYILPNTLAWDGEEQRAKGKGQRGKGEGLRTKISELASDLRPLTSGLRLLSVCRMDEREQYKGVDTVIRALPAVLERVPDLKYEIVGDGSDLARHKQLADELGVSKHVEFRGSLDEWSLRSAYWDSDIFVLPSAGEGFGIVFLEAMHYAKPVIAANSGATSEVVKDGETGLLIEYGNVEQLTEVIVALSLDPERRKKMGRAGNEWLQQKFAFGSFKRKLDEIILGELAARTTRPEERQIARSANSFS